MLERDITMRYVLVVLCCLYAVCPRCVHCNEKAVVKVQCDSGWMMFENHTCIMIKHDLRTYSNAMRFCRNQEGQLVTLLAPKKEMFLIDNGLNGTNKYWIGLKRRSGMYKKFKWYMYGLQLELEYENWSNKYDSWYSYSSERCAYLLTETVKWDSTTQCTNEEGFVCEKKTICTEGRFGRWCDRFCHCHGETCNSVTGECKYGCQKGWFGPRCDKEKVPADVVFYCFNTTALGPHMLLRVNPRGVSYASLNGLDENDKPMHTCDIDSFNLDNGVYSKVVNVADSQTNTCGGRMTSKSKWQWRFALREQIGVVSENDVIFGVKCDFEHADPMKREGRQEIQGKVEAKVQDVSETKEDVQLSIIDSFTHTSVKEIEIGTNVRLLLRIVKKEGSSAKAVSPYNCEAFSSNRAYTRELTNQYGCAVRGSPVSEMHGENGSAISQLFPMFTFPGISEVNFRCDYQYCFKSEDKCRNRCRFYVGRHKRSADGAEKVLKPVHTTVRVLARGQQENKNVDPPEDKNRGVPLLYLNPITCSMFLFLLTVFLLYYVFFIKSLKRSVEEMKQEIRRHNRHNDLLL